MKSRKTGTVLRPFDAVKRSYGNITFAKVADNARFDINFAYATFFIVVEEGFFNFYTGFGFDIVNIIKFGGFAILV